MDIKYSKEVASISSNIINLISDTNNNADEQRDDYEFIKKDDKTNKYIIKKDDPKYKQTRAVDLKEKKDNFNEKHDFNFFGNIPCDFYDRDKYNSLGSLTFDFVDKTIDKEKLKENDDMKIKLEFLNGGTSLNSHEQFVTINNDGTNNGMFMDKEHFAETNKSIKLKSIMDEKNNDEALCSLGGMKTHKSRRKRNNNSCHYVPNMVINNKENNSEDKKYSSYEKNLDNIAFAILAAGKVDGTMVKELDKNGQLVPIKIKITINGEEHELSIKDIIPSLKELEDIELENKFSKLYDMAIMQYSENFDTYYDEEKDKLYYNENPSDSIKKKNILSHIINSYNINDNDEIESIELSPDDINLHYSSNNELDNKFKSFIYNANEDELLNLDVNNSEEYSKIVDKYWNESNEMSNSDKEIEALYKMVAVHCVKSIRCNKQFKKANNDKLSYTIVHYTSENKGNNIDNYSLIINNEETEQTINAFTITKDESKNYKFDELNEYKEYTREDLNLLNKNKNANKIYIDNIEYAIKPGLGLIAECEFDLKDMTGKVVEPNSIFIENSDTNKEYNEEYNNKYIEKKYDVKNNGKYNMNLIKAEALDLYVDCQFSMKDVRKKLLGKRYVHDELSKNEMKIFNNYSNILINNNLYDNENRIVHFSNEKDFNSNFDNLKESVNLQNEIKTIKNHQSGCLAKNPNLSKRENANGGKCLRYTEVSKNYGAENSLVDSLNTLKQYDSENIILNENEKSISNPKELCKNAETLTNVLNISLESFENIDKMSDEESEKLIINLLEFVKGLDYRYKSANYLNHKSIRNINKYDIDDMFKICSDIIRHYRTKHDDDGVVHRRGVTFIKVEPPTLTIDPESKYVNDELHETYNNLHDLINEYDQDITNINLVDDMDINNKSGRENRNKELKYLLKKFKNMKVTGSKQSKEKFKSDLLNLFDRMIELEKIFDKANFEKNDFVNNSESVYKLTNGIVSKLNKDYPNDNEVQNHLLSYKDTIGGIEKINVKSTNILNSDHVIGEVDIEDYIFNDPNSKMYVKRYFDKLKDDLYDIDTDEEHINSVNKINDIKEKIMEKINIMKRYKKPDGHYHEAYHLIELINCYNELVATTLSFDRENNEINYIYISDDPDLYEIFNHLRVKIKSKIENKIIKSNPDNFNTEKYQSVEDITTRKDAKEYIFGDSSVYEASYKDYNKIIKDNKVTSNTEVLKNFVESSTNNHQLLGIKESYNLGYKITENELPNYRDEDMVNSVNELESSKKLFKNIKNNNIKYFETSEQTETRFINNIIADAKIENINNNKKFTIDSVIDEVNDKDIINNMDDDQKENVQKQIENVCLNERNEIIKYSGVTPSSSYEEMNEGYNSFESKSINLMKRISNKDDTNEKNYEKLTLPKKLITHNKLNSSKINSESPRIKNPPLNKHKYGNKKKRNIEYIKYFHRYY